jgi:hypothetical protein
VSFSREVRTSGGSQQQFAQMATATALKFIYKLGDEIQKD